jgi:hypothetical protein
VLGAIVVAFVAPQGDGCQTAGFDRVFQPEHVSSPSLKRFLMANWTPAGVFFRLPKLYSFFRRRLGIVIFLPAIRDQEDAAEREH